MSIARSGVVVVGALCVGLLLVTLIHPPQWRTPLPDRSAGDPGIEVAAGERLMVGSSSVVVPEGYFALAYDPDQVIDVGVFPLEVPEPVPPALFATLLASGSDAAVSLTTLAEHDLHGSLRTGHAVVISATGDELVVRRQAVLPIVLYRREANAILRFEMTRPFYRSTWKEILRTASSS